MSKPAEVLEEEELTRIYEWVDSIPLSRPKRNIARDFSDGVLIAEIFKHFIPSIIDLHNYPPANAARQKLANWETLNKKVLSRLDFQMDVRAINDIVNCVPEAIEKVLKIFKEKIEIYLAKNKPRNSISPKLKNNGDRPRDDEVLPSELIEKEEMIQQLRETIEVMELKIKQLEEICEIKEDKIADLEKRSQEAGLA
ncbi:SPEF1_3 [Blepharisma stoltei]|uniref:Calponin-homology (CH) domain-containing protein n=1 Tax=Blepharisma stoltei TaxID=1481888 RepID=A0AAU9ITR8_9CILI|nr:unnamed protein product [Blepharisma stoltei]